MKIAVVECFWSMDGGGPSAAQYFSETLVRHPFWNRDQALGCGRRGKPLCKSGAYGSRF